MADTLQHNDLIIELFDDPTFRQNDNSPTSYDTVIQLDQDKPYCPNAQHAIKIYKDTNLINSAIILASGGATTVLGDTALVNNGNLIIRCCNKVFSLTLPELETNWVTEADWATCFSLHRYQDTYISYGETSIVRIDTSGKILWSYEGADIFVSLEGENPFEMHENYIALTDFNGSTYKIDYDGKNLEQKSEDYNQKRITIFMKLKKMWLNFGSFYCWKKR